MKKGWDWKGKKVLITGGGSGIGLAIAAEAAARGAVPILVDINPEALASAEASLHERGHEAIGFRVDVTDIDAVRGLRDKLLELSLSPDVLVNCAGVTLVAHVTSTEHEEWKRIIDVNLMGTVNVVETFLPDLVEKGSGHIVNIGSIDGLVPVPGQSAYCASKFAVTGMSEVLYYDLKPQGIGVTLVCPGYVNTPMARSHPIKDLPIRFQGWEKVARLLEVFSGRPEKVASRALDGAERARFLVIPGLPSRLMYHYRRFFPQLAAASGVAVGKLYARLRRLQRRRALEGYSP